MNTIFLIVYVFTNIYFSNKDFYKWTNYNIYFEAQTKRNIYLQIKNSADENNSLHNKIHEKVWGKKPLPKLHVTRLLVQWHTITISNVFHLDKNRVQQVAMFSKHNPQLRQERNADTYGRISKNPVKTTDYGLTPKRQHNWRRRAFPTGSKVKDTYRLLRQ